MPIRGTRSFILEIVALMIAALAHCTMAPAQDMRSPKYPVKTEAPAATAPVDPSAQTPSDSIAERITNIRRVLQADETRKVELQDSVIDLEESYKQASARFNALDSQYTAEKTKSASKVGEPISEVAQHERLKLENERNKARDEFDRILKRRKALQQQLDVLNEKIALAKAALDRATSTEAPKPKAAELNPIKTEVPAKAPSFTDENSPGTEKTAVGPKVPGVPAVDSATKKTEQIDDKTVKTADKAAKKDEPPVDVRTLQARHELAEKETSLEVAKANLVNRDRAIEVFRADLESIRQLLQIATDDMQNAQAAALLDEVRLTQRQQAGAQPTEIEQLRTKAADSQHALEVAKQEVARQKTQFAENDKLLRLMEQGRKKIVADLDTASAEVASASRLAEFLASPFSPQNLKRYFLKAGPRLFGLFLAVMTIWWLSRLLSRRIVAAVIRRGTRGSTAERRSRAETLSRVFQSTANSLILLLGACALLEQVGVDVSVLLGGAAVVGAAIAFGAQNVIKDFFCGFMILVENQYSVGNVVRMGSISGAVEDITLRMTVLRDEEGVVHFIPHSQVTTVSNLTYGWSRAVFNVKLGYGEDIDRIMNELLELGRELRQDDAFESDILDDPEMLGVDSLGDNSLQIKFLLKTRPLRQWAVKREMLRRIKLRFDELGIVTPKTTKDEEIRSVVREMQTGR